MKPATCFLALGLALFPVRSFAAQDAPPPGAEPAGETIEEAKSLSGLDLVEKADSLIAAIQAESPDTINAVIQPLLTEPFKGASAPLRFLRDIQFRIKGFDNGEGETGLGFSYAYERAFAPAYLATDRQTRGLQLDLRAAGNVAFEKAFNPEDFLDSRLALRVFQNTGGVAVETTDKLKTRLNEIDGILSRETDPDKLASHPLNDELEQIKSRLELQSYIDLRLHTGLEANQDFTQRHLTYGAQIGIDIKAYNPASWQAKANILDYPFAAVRWLSGYDEKFQPRGSTIPSLLFGLDQVEPEGDADPRAVAGDDSEFARFRAEVLFRTPLATIGDRDIFFDASYRHFKELEPSPLVEEADLAEFGYLVLAITSAKGVFVSYADGKLPFDLQDQQTYQIGVQFHLQ